MAVPFLFDEWLAAHEARYPLDVARYGHVAAWRGREESSPHCDSCLYLVPQARRFPRDARFVCACYRSTHYAVIFGALCYAEGFSCSCHEPKGA